MQQVKIFIGVEQEPALLEQEVNDWLRESGARIISMQANIAPQTLNSVNSTRGSINEGPGRRFAPSDLFVCVVYEIDS